MIKYEVDGFQKKMQSEAGTNFQGSSNRNFLFQMI